MQVQPHQTSPHVTGAIRQAAHSTGASFDYLLATAQIESNFNPSAQAATSSAQGLYQFIDQTWLATMKNSGPSLGFGQFASAITRMPDGRYDVADPATRNAIMRLRADPKASAMMAGAYARNNADQLTDGLGRTPTEGELYIAHFLGSDGAAKLIGAALSAPKMKATDIFPQAAGANRPIFYDRSGSPRSALDVYRVLTDKYEAARAGNAAQTMQVASVTPTPPTPPVTGALRGTLPATSVALATSSAMPSPQQVARAIVPDTAGITSAYADARAEQRPTIAEQSIFHSMVTTPPRQGVAPVVTSLWTPATGEQKPATAAASLFTDIKTAPNKGKGGV